MNNTIMDSNMVTEFSMPINDYKKNILNDEAIEFATILQKTFNPRRLEILKARKKRQSEVDSGIMPNFSLKTKPIRESDWKIAPIPNDLQDRRVEITGPVDRKMIINALNSNVKVFMADFEDSTSPTWENIINGQINLKDAIDKTISFTNLNGKHYELNDKTATLMVRPRGWHLEEKHVKYEGNPFSASIFDFAIFFYNNAKTLIESNSGPYFYLPKLENHLEARLWNDIFNMAQDELNIPRGTIKATVLIETIFAAFEMDEILFELREHSAGLNCGRWDYIFSFIKKFRNYDDFVLPDRSLVTMDCHFLKSYVSLLIQTCHKRGAHAMGGMAAQIPIKNDPMANENALQKVKNDKEREAMAGHDGTWIAHPALAPIALEAFNTFMPNENQINISKENILIHSTDLLKVPKGKITETGIRTNLRVGIQYVAAWLSGNGCVPLYHLMEDAATAEISRAQLWQWIHHDSKLDNGTIITPTLINKLKEEEMKIIASEVGEKKFNEGTYHQACDLFIEMINNDDFDEFLTLPAYSKL